MNSIEKVKKKLQNALKLSGFSVRREFCSLLIATFVDEGVDLNDNVAFDTIVRSLCTSLENQCLAEKSIEKEHIERAIEVCLHSGYDRHESIFSVINAFDVPKLAFNPDRKLYFIDKKRSSLLAEADIKAKLFLERYYTVLQRTKRNFQQKVSAGEKNQLNLQTIDYLLTLSNVTLDYTLILGSLIQASEGKWHIEDPTGMVELNLTHAKYHGGFFVENCFVLINGYYEDRILHVSTVVLPPGEEYKNSRISFGSLNYFGGESSVPLRDSRKLKEHMMQNSSKLILFFSDVWLDHPLIFEKLEYLFEGFEEMPPVAFVFMGNFMSTSHGNEVMQNLRKQFKKLAELILKYPNISSDSEFVFVPGIADPCTPHIVPRFGLPDYVTGEMKRLFPKAIFPTNPCRLQYCNREIVLFRADLVPKFLQGTLHKPSKDQIADCKTGLLMGSPLSPLLAEIFMNHLENQIHSSKFKPLFKYWYRYVDDIFVCWVGTVRRTVISQGHLSPLSLNSLTVHWDFDYTLRLYPLPDLVVIGDKFEAYEGEYKDCLLMNPGSFCEGFQFKSYTPSSNTVDDCDLDVQTE